jgi:rSAM/selenodomain-associated transferase 2
MKISIIIPTYNEQEFIVSTIKTIKKRACKNSVFQIIVADGGSTDNTVMEAEKAGAIIVHATKKRRGTQMNEGAASATGELLYFLHADTLPPPHFDQHIRTSVEGGNPAGCFRLSFDDDHPLLRFYGWCTRFDIDVFRFGDQSLFITKELFKQIGGFRDDHILMEDQDIVKSIKEDYSFSILPQEVTSSSRKYMRNGALRLQGIYVLIVMLYKAGVKQQKLYSVYKKWVH